MKISYDFKVGEIIMLSDYDYSQYAVLGHYEVLKDFNGRDKYWLADTLPLRQQYPDVDNEHLLAHWLVQEGYLRKLHTVVEWHVQSTGMLSGLSARPDNRDRLEIHPVHIHPDGAYEALAEGDTRRVDHWAIYVRNAEGVAHRYTCLPTEDKALAVAKDITRWSRLPTHYFGKVIYTSALSRKDD